MNMMYRVGYLLFILILFPSAFAADSTYFNDHERGWHWYEPQPTEAEKKEQTDPVQQLDTIRATVKRALDNAILYPTKENVKTYMQLQQETVERSDKFRKVWTQVLLDAPELNETLKHPISNLGRQIESQQKLSAEDNAMATIAKQSGLFYFYRSTCPYCRAFSPVLKKFAENHGLTVIPITTNGVSLPEFPDSFTDHGQAATFEVKVEPALFMVNPYTKKATPVTYGLVSEEELKERLLQIVRDQEEEKNAAEKN